MLAFLPALLVAYAATFMTMVDSSLVPLATLSPTFDPDGPRPIPEVCQNLSVNVTPCERIELRDLLFIVDASKSLDPNVFQNEILDYTQDLFCAFDPRLRNRAGMITFAGSIEVRIPLAVYSAEEWFSKVEEIRGQDLCCSCCTPMAEAFELALDTWLTSGPIDPAAYPINFVITDGAPWQNNGNSKWANGKVSAANYAYTIVPEQSLALKQFNERSRVILVGVPNKNLVPPRADYFAGIPDPTKAPNSQPFVQCITRDGKRSCDTMELPPFPISSMPLEDNIFEVQDIEQAINETVGALCEIIPTKIPTVSPSFSPSTVPTTSIPSVMPTLSPSTTLPTMRPTTVAPSLDPTQPPTTQSPTEAPSNNPSHTPTTAVPTQSPTYSPSHNPTVSPSKAPTVSAPTKNPTVSSPTVSPTLMPTNSPTEREIPGIDIYFFLDRSNSMRWVPDLCRAAPGGDPLATDVKACWKLFLAFVRSSALAAANLPFRDTVIGWKDDDPMDLLRGNRIFLYAFACEEQQSTPVAITIREEITSLAQFDAAIAEAELLVPFGGTCPGAVIERAVAAVQRSQPTERVFKAAPLLTDGVFYDMPRPAEAVKGMFNFQVLTYAFAIAVPDENNEFWLDAQERAVQREQLLTYVDGDSNRIFNFGADGLPLLEDIAQEWAEQMFGDLQTVPINTNLFWCGWTSKARCLETDPTKTNTGHYCKYMSYRNYGCLDKDWCNFGVTGCQRDSYCKRSSGNCIVKQNKLPLDWPN